MKTAFIAHDGSSCLLSLAREELFVIAESLRYIAFRMKMDYPDGVPQGEDAALQKLQAQLFDTLKVLNQNKEGSRVG